MKKSVFPYIFITILVVVFTVYLFGKQKPESDRAIQQLNNFNYLPTSTTKEIVKHHHYTLSYSEKDEQAEWVAYELTAEETQPKFKRSNHFVSDPEVRTGSATPDDYKKSGYDRGHLAPAADMEFAADAEKECFYMSNMSPQDKAFNRGIWNQLEEQVRYWARTYGKIYVVTAGVLSKTQGFIGHSNHVSIPKYFYKTILTDYNCKLHLLTVLLPNEEGHNSLQSYSITTDSLEKLTHIDFWHTLPDSVESKLESRIEQNFWWK